MRFLANENFPLDAVEALRQQEHDVGWIRAESPGISDTEVLSRAQVEDRILSTFDKDFGELAFRAKLPAASGIILFRITAPSSAVVAQKVVAAIALRDDWAGHFNVVKEDRSGTIGKRSGTIGKRSGTIGRRSGTIGRRSGTIGRRSGTIGKGSALVLQCPAAVRQASQNFVPMTVPRDLRPMTFNLPLQSVGSDRLKPLQNQGVLV